MQLDQPHSGPSTLPPPHTGRSLKILIMGHQPQTQSWPSPASAQFAIAYWVLLRHHKISPQRTTITIQYTIPHYHTVVSGAIPTTLRWAIFKHYMVSHPPLPHSGQFPYCTVEDLSSQPHCRACFNHRISVHPLCHIVDRPTELHNGLPPTPHN